MLSTMKDEASRILDRWELAKSKAELSVLDNTRRC